MGFVKWVPIIAAYIRIFFFIVSSFAEEAPYPSFAKDGTSAAETEWFDYIIVGGGTAGCAVAATLSSSSAKVLLLERGGLPYNNPNVFQEMGFLASLLDTSPRSAAQQFVSTDGVPNYRGRVLGGTSAINAGFFSRADDEFLRDVGLDPWLVNNSYEWVERKVAFRPKFFRWQAAVMDGLVEAGVFPYNRFSFEHLQGTKIGGTIFDEKGYRHTAADLLEYADPTKITVYLHASVHQILFENSPGQKPKACGVVFRDSKGCIHTTLLNNNSTASEIIVSAGALGSPQLLMLSGIGPAHHLKAHGINVILDQPMVGQGMSDNPKNGILIPSPRPVEDSLIKVAGITDEVGCYFEGFGGRFGAGTLISPTDQSLIQSGFIAQKLARPFSTGYLELQSKDPNENPRVTFNYFQDPRDLEMCVNGMGIIRRAVESKAYSRYRYPDATFESLMDLMLELSRNPTRKAGAHSLEQFCVDTVRTFWHYHGGCQVGRVVDPDYRVMGVDSLRVIDGSTFYNSPGTNPHATVMMLGRYMGLKILQQS